MWELIKNFILKHSKINNIKTKIISYNDILTKIYENDKLTIEVYEDFVYLIISNEFAINPAQLIMFYKEHYDFTIDEFFIILFKLGVASEMYVNDPKSLISDALTIPNKFNEKQLVYLNKLKKTYELEDSTEKKHFDDSINKINAKKNISNDDANRMIDFWKTNKKK